jgi:putative hemolysin
VIGVTTINRLNEVLDHEISEDEYDTIGGLVFGLLGHIPEIGEFIVHDKLRLSVEELDGRRIQTVRISAHH